MKKTVLFILSFLFLTSLAFGDVFMTEIADPNNNLNARFIELYNNGATAVDFTEGSGWRINKYTNGSATVSQFQNLTGTIAAGGFYICAYDYVAGTFLSVFGFAADQLDSTSNGTFGGNGDDTLELVDGTGTVVDFYGVQPHADLTDSVWEFEDGRAERAGVATTGTNPPVDADWNTWSDGPGGDIVATQDAPADFDPGAWIGTGGNLLPTILNILRNPSGDILASTTVEVSADVTDSDGTITLVELNWGTTSGSLGNTITMSLDTGDTYVTDTDIPAQVVGTTIYYEVYAEDDVPESSTSSEYDYTVIEPATTTLPYDEPFNANLGACYSYSVSGATKEWYWNDGGYAAMNGHDSGETEEDWFILPAIDFDSRANETMTFDTWYNYGSEDVNNYFKLYYSPDYPGLGDPSSSTWTELSFTQPSSTSTWTTSGSLDLSAITGSAVYIAYKYHYESGSYRSWGVDNISIIEGNPPLVADFEANQTFVPPGSTVNFTDLTTGGVTPYSYEWDFSYDGITFNVEETLSNPAWEFPTEGVFDIALRVTDNELTVDEEIKVAYITVAEVAEGILINEIDADQDGTDAAEFIELYDGGVGNTALDGLVIVKFNGSDDQSYAPAYDLDGYSTDANGYFVIGSSSVPNVDYDLGALTNIIQNGADAVALYTGDAVDFPEDTPITTTNLIDAIVYGTSDPDDAGLLVLLNALEPQVDENSNSAAITESNQRIPNGSGGARNTSTYAQTIPTPGTINQAGTLDAPADLTIVVNGNDIDLNWTVVAGATGYNVFRSTDPYSFGAAYDTSVTNSYTDVGAAGGVKYFYMVTATN